VKELEPIKWNEALVKVLNDRPSQQSALPRPEEILPADSWSRDYWKQRADTAETRIRELEIANRDLWYLRDRNQDLEKQARDARTILKALKDLLAATDRIRDFGRLIAARDQARRLIEEHEKQ
jgi:hypothetical protein